MKQQTQQHVVIIIELTSVWTVLTALAIVPRTTLSRRVNRPVSHPPGSTTTISTGTDSRYGRLTIPMHGVLDARSSATRKSTIAGLALITLTIQVDTGMVLRWPGEAQPEPTSTSGRTTSAGSRRKSMVSATDAPNTTSTQGALRGLTVLTQTLSLTTIGLLIPICNR